MASVKKRGDKYYVIYYYKDPDTKEQKQKWESFVTEGEAYKRKIEVENQMNDNTFILPRTTTVSEYLDSFVKLYGTTKWGASTFKSNTALIRNYISPIIGDIKLQELNRMTIDSSYKKLSQTEYVEYRGRKPEGFLSASVIEKIAHLMSTAMKQAVQWEIISKDPTIGALRERPAKVERSIWNTDQIKKALDNCEDNRLYLAINLSFACSLRLGEILGLTWDCVHISEQEIASDGAWIMIQKELTRVNMDAVKQIGEKDIYQIFPTTKYNATTRMVLKKPKTESSIRKVWLPKTLAMILLDWKKKQEELKDLIGDAFSDYNLVVTHNDGRPCDSQVIEHGFKRLKEKADLPDVVFHSLRHSSTTYKLGLTHGNIKDVQGDTGHATAQMVTEVYSHIMDESRKENAMKFDEAFYKQPDLRSSMHNKQEDSEEFDVSKLLKAVQKSPELKNALKQLLAE